MSDLLNFMPNPSSSLSDYDQIWIYGRFSEVWSELSFIQNYIWLFIIIAFVLGIAVIFLWWRVTDLKNEVVKLRESLEAPQ